MKPPLSGCAAFPSLSTRFALGEGDNTFAARRLLLGVSEVGHASFRQKGCQRLCIKRWQLLFW